MRAATWPRPSPLAERLLLVDPARASFEDARVRDLPMVLRAGDLVVVNDAATFPASLSGSTSSGARIEARLAGRLAGGAWRAVLFGEGDWRTKTEDRPAPPRLVRGEALTLGGLSARVEAVLPASPRLVALRFDADDDVVWRALYAAGRYVQYAYTKAPLAPWHLQTVYAAEPWASEMPSAGRPLTWALLLGLLGRGVRLAHVTHAAGLSSTGEARLDAALPLPERFRIPAETARAVDETTRAGGRVVAVGTTVVRALEGAAIAAKGAHGSGRVLPGEGTTDLVIGPGFRPRVAAGLLTGLHERGASHFALLEAFAPRPLLERAYTHAEHEGYLCHEFGDSSLILPSAHAESAA
jgi:S-adenosylmethionine:tRNA ribosyltransferase-isomerase